MSKSFWSFLTGLTIGILICLITFQWKQAQINNFQSWIEKYIWFSSTSSSVSSTNYDEKFSQILAILKTQYISWDNIDISKLREASLRWLVEWLEDPYTIYMPAQDSKLFLDDLKWNNDFEWIWAVIGKTQWTIVVEQVLKESPAAKAWIKPLDHIVQIWEEPTMTMSATDAVKKIRWPKWTSINIWIVRWEEVLKLSVTRDKISVPSVESKVLNYSGANFWYVSIAIFWDETSSIFKKEMENLKNQNLSGIIIDVRWNWWGYLPVASDIASYFIPKDKLIVSGKYKNLPDENYNSKGYEWFQWKPIVVLIDWLSASASEIIALALKQDANATLVWTKTFWKWSIQTLYNWFWDGSSIKFTLWKWYAPDWSNIDRIWINPDVEIKFDREKYEKESLDVQLEKAKEILFWKK